MKLVIHYIYIGVLLISFVALLLIIPFVNDPNCMLEFQSLKTLYFTFAVIPLTIVIIATGIFGKKYFLNIKPLDVLIGVYYFFSVLHPLFFAYSISSIDWIEAISLAVWYLLVRQVSEKYLTLLFYTVILAGVAQGIIGIMQLYGLSPSNNGIFKMTGSFLNPGPYAGYLASIFPVALLFYIVNKHIEIKKNEQFTNHGIQDFFLKYSPLFAIIMILLVLPASRSRAAWLGVSLSCFFVIWTFRDRNKIKFHFTLFQQKYIVLTFFLIVTIALAGLYKFKQDSASGRLLIWKVAANIVSEKPIWGHGINKFAAEYMNYQADFFKLNPEIDEALLADNISYPYNEFIKITIEKGFIGLLLSLCVLWGLFFLKPYSEKKSDQFPLLAARASLISIIVFGMFSYPSEILPIKILFLLSSAIVATYQTPVQFSRFFSKEINRSNKQSVSVAIKVIWYVTFVFSLYLVYPVGKYLIKQYQAYKSWEYASDLYNSGSYEYCLKDFAQAYPQLKTNGTFLVQYGKALEMAKKFESSINILNKAKEYLNNTILYTSLGNDYKSLGNYAEAELAYLQAWHMVPSRFYPMYLLVKLYDETGKGEKAVAMAKKILEKKIKVPSKAIEEIRDQMQKIIIKY